MSTNTTNTTKAEQAVAYAALILADEHIRITPEKLQAILYAAGVEDVEPIWTTLFAKALEGRNVKEILTAVTAAPVGRSAETGSKENGTAAGENEGGEQESECIDIDADSDDGSAFGDLFG